MADSPDPEVKPTAAVVLGSGGARGYAHIGALEVIEASGYEVIAVAGCSMGALVGGLYAAGNLDEYRDWAITLRQRDVLRLVDLSLSSMGAIRGDKLFSMVGEMIGDVAIENLPIAYTAVATDLLSQREVWFQDGSLSDAIRASIAIPSLLAPVVTDNQLLVDGALMNPVPILPTLSAQADITIAVHLSGETRRHSPTKPSGPLVPVVEGADDPAVEDERWASLRERAARLLDWDVVRAKLSRDGERSESDDLADFSRFDIMNLAYETMQSTLTSYKLAGYPPDVLVEIPKSSARTFEFHRAEELIEIGRSLTESALADVGV
ncbi:patatin-like phospholipase family protein [Actinospongicola halichondriae]|uniref:patatin-like phospholipase family protein n=1 Tax=Actinospongicola halichondriae TaxID=3236844 RepID=UPI003D4A1B07